MPCGSVDSLCACGATTRTPRSTRCETCHQAEARAKVVRYRHRNLNLARARVLAWRRANPERNRANSLRSYYRRLEGHDPDGAGYVDILRADPCAYCGGPGGTIDHVRPVADAGPNSWDNLTSACAECNSNKGTKSLLVFLSDRIGRVTNP